MSVSPVSSSLPPRNPGLDRARAVAVIAMVMGHTLDAVLSDEARQSTAMLVYWSFRAVTAPLFLFVAGWAFATTVQRKGLGGWVLVRRYLPRVLLLLGWGYLLHWPGWDVAGLLAGETEVWRHLLVFDALHGVAGSLLVGVGVFAVVVGREARLGVMAALALLVPAVSPWVRETVGAGKWPLALELALVGRASTFPLFPWAAYFFVGCGAGLVLSGVKRTPHGLLLLGVGTAVLGAVSLVAGIPPWSDLLLVAWRVGLVSVVAGLAMGLPARLDGVLGPVGRASLWVYVVHLPLAYGWSTFPGLASRVGRSQEAFPALGIALAVLGSSLAVALLAKRLYEGWRKRDRPPPTRPSLLPGPPISG